MTSQWLAISVTHSLTYKTENNVKVEELFEDDANYPKPEDATYDKLKNFNEDTYCARLAEESENCVQD